MIGDILKRIRTIYGYKAKEMSALLKISPSYLSEIENNKKPPSLDLLQKYSEIFGIKVSSLLLLSEEYEDLSKGTKSDKFIKRIMELLIKKMSPGVDGD